MEEGKIESKKLMKEMNEGDVIEFPIASMETIRNNVTILNAKHFLEGKKWESKSIKEKGIIYVTRTS